MSKYRVIRGSNRLYSVFDDNSPICRMIADEMEANGLLTELENRDENAATQALALEAQSERIAALEKFIRDVAEWVANPEEGRLRQRHELDALLLAAHKEKAQELVAEWDKAEKPDTPVNAPKPTEEIKTLCAIPVLQKRLVTKNNDVMALISMGDDTLVMFPRAWHEYKDVFVVAFENRKAITVKAKADYSHGELQYIFEEML